MKSFLTLITLTASLLAACRSTPAPGQSMPAPANPTATYIAQSLQTATPTFMGTWKMVLEGVIYDIAIGGPIAGASVHYRVVHSYFPEIQEGWPNGTVSDRQGKFSLPMIVHDTDNIRIVVEAPGYMTHEEKLNLLGDRWLSMGLTPLATSTVREP